MRWWTGGGALLMVALAGACRQAAPEPIAGDGELVLELGGGNRSLAASLRSLGVELLPPHEPPASAVDAGEAQPQPVDAAANAPPKTPAPAVAPAPAPGAATWFEVPLSRGQTLMDLALKHLGSGLRFKEILQLNGWTEKEARRLKVGQRVKIPKDPR